MSHAIMANDRQDGKVQAWHGLTNIMPDLSLENNWLTLWDGEPVRLVTEDEVQKSAKRGKVVSAFSILRATDKPDLLIGKPFDAKTYKPVFNRDFLDLARKLVEKYPGCTLETAGSLRDRKRVFLTLTLPKDNGGEYSAGGREFRGMFNLLNSFDGSCPVMGVGSNVCTVCDNTFSANMATGFGDEGESAVIGRHTKGLCLETLREAMEECIGAQMGFASEFDKLSKRGIDLETATFAFAGFVGEKRAALSSRSAGIVEELTVLFQRGNGSNGDDLGDWFSAITDFYTHRSATLATDSDGKAKQWLSSEFGTGAKTKASAWFAVTNEGRIAKLAEQGRDLWQAWLKDDDKAKRVKAKRGK